MQTVYITCPPEWADELARSIIDERLAACVNAIECRSTYWWDDEVNRERERILLCKTTADRYPALVDHVRELHPHDVPCIERFEAAHVLEGYADWVAESVQPDAG